MIIRLITELNNFKEMMGALKNRIFDQFLKKFSFQIICFGLIRRNWLDFRPSCHQNLKRLVYFTVDISKHLSGSSFLGSSGHQSSQVKTNYGFVASMQANIFKCRN